MMAFVVVSLVALALVVGAWLKLGPGPDERRQARVRAQALAAGCRVRLVGREERERHALPAACWYVMADVQPPAGAAERLLLRRGTGWVDATGSLPVHLRVEVPAGVQALRRGADDVAVAWDERDEGELAGVLALLASLRGQGSWPVT